MPLDDVEVRRVTYTLQPELAFALGVGGEQCYGEDCIGCCGSATTYLTRADLEALRTQIDTLLEQGA